MLNKVKNKSSFIAEAVRERIEKEQKIRMMDVLREGYRATRNEDKALSKEWESTIRDGIDFFQ